MYSVVNANSEEIGYIINDIFLESSIIEKQTNEVEPTETVCGMLQENGVLTSKGFFRNADVIVNTLNYTNLINSLKSENIDLNDILFIPCSSRGIQQKYMSGFWRLTNDTIDSSYLYLCIDSNTCNVLAYLLTLRNIFKSQEIHIGMIESTKKHRGYGTKVVSQLKAFNKPITGLSVATAVSFWEKQGAKFDSSKYFRL